LKLRQSYPYPVSSDHYTETQTSLSPQPKRSRFAFCYMNIMGALSAFFELLLRIDSRLVTMNGLVQLLLEHHQSLEQLLMQKIAVQPIWLDNQEVMQKLKISESTLKRHRLTGVIRSTRIGGKYYYNEADIQNLLREGM
jgi:hypothetical protein